MKITPILIWFAFFNFLWNLVPTINTCADGMLDCQTCMDSFNCAVCYPGYGLIQPGTGIQCSLCQVGGCEECSTSLFVCNKCVDPQGVRLSGSSYTCVPCDDPNCSTCSHNATVCEQCDSMPYLGLQIATGLCFDCVDANCIWCTSDTLRCDQCTDGFGVSLTATCVSCRNADALCLRCTSATICQQCDPNYGVLMGHCVMCNIPNCNLCSASALSCTGCTAPFGLNSLGTCSFCAVTHCLMCQMDYLICSGCELGYGLVPGFVTCANCTDSKCAQCGSDIATCTLCKPGFGMSGGACINCLFPCAQCQSSDHTKCTTCVGGYYHSVDNCLPCMLNCLECSTNATCITCSTSWYLDPTNSCILCPFRCSTCIYNPNFGQPKCNSCISGSEFDPYHVPRICQEICGDGQTGDYSCDNALGVNYDGCDDDCQVMTDFVCNVIYRTGATLCSYTGILQMQITRFYKNPVANDFVMTVKYVCYSLPVLGWISFFLGVILRKLPGLEAICVLQFALCSMVELNCDLIWPFEQTHPLRFATAFNYAFIQEDDSTQSMSAPYFSQYHMSPRYFANNYNLTPFLLQVASLLYLLFTTVKVQTFIRESKNLQKDFVKQEEQSVSELEALIDKNERAHTFLMHSCMVSLVYFAFCSALYFKMYSTPNIPSLLLFILGSAIFLFTFVRFGCDPCSFDYFRFSFQISQLAMNHYFLYAAVLVVSITLLVAVPDITFAPVVPLALLLLYTLLYRPYKELRENLRSAFNLLVMCSLAGFRIYVGFLPKKQLASSTVMTFFLVIIVIMLPTFVILSLVSTIYSYIQQIRLLKEEKCLQNNRLSLIRKKTRRILFELGIVSINTNMGHIKDETIFRELIDNNYNIKMVSNKLKDEFAKQQLMNCGNDQRAVLAHTLLQDSNSTSKHLQYKQEIKLDLMLKKPKKPTDDVLNDFSRRRHSPQILEMTKIERKGSINKSSITKSSQAEGRKRHVDQIEVDSEYQIAKTVLAEENKFVNLRGAVEYVRQQQKQPVDENADLYLQEFNQIKL